MALCCIGGICIPYSAIIPLLIYGMKWTLEQLLKYGILPTSWGQYLLQQQPTKSNNNSNNTTKSSCCNSSNSSSEAEAVPKQRRGKQTKQTSTSFCSSTTATTSSSSSSRGSSFNDEEDENVVIVKACETEEDWEDLLNNNKTTICKFTAPWCKPCKQIQPLFEQLANEKSLSTEQIQFATIDADQLDDIAAEFGVMGLPCFVAIDNNNSNTTKNSILEKYTGSNPQQLRAFVQRVEEKTK